MLRAVYFDLDGTLYDRDALVAQLAGGQWDTFRDDLAPVSRETFVARVLALDEHGHRSKAELYRTLTAAFELDAMLAPRLEQHFWAVYDAHCALSEDTRATLDMLRRHGLTLGVITNGGTERQQSKLRALGLDSFFDVVVISEREGVRKPDAEIFRRALRRGGVDAGETVFVGDHPDADIRGARGAGLTAIWKRVPYWRMDITGVTSVDRLSEILPYCLPAGV